MSRREAVDALLAELPMSDDGTGHVADCGFDPDSIRPCGCYDLPERLERIVAAREAALAERIAQAIDRERVKGSGNSAAWLAAMGDAARIAREIGGQS